MAKLIKLTLLFVAKAARNMTKIKMIQLAQKAVILEWITIK